MASFVMARDNLLDDAPNCWEPGSNAFRILLRPETSFSKHRGEVYHLPNEIAVCLTRPWIYAIGCYASPAQWLFNPNTQKEEEDYLLKLMPESVADGIRNGSGWLMLCNGHEGRDCYGGGVFNILHTSLKHRGIPANKTIFITANFLHDKMYQKWCDQHSISNRMHTIVTDSWEVMTSNFLNTQPEKCFSISENPIKSLREKHYLCYNRRVHKHRFAVGMYLQQQDLLSKGLVSFPSREIAEDRDIFKPITHPWWGATKEDMVMFTDKTKHQEFVDGLPLLVDVPTLKHNLANNYTAWPYQKTYFSLVNETQLNYGSLFLSEKTYKPMIHCHPFIVVGSRHTLRKLREDGYRTFDLDESYDEEYDPFRRMMMALEQVRKLCDMPLSRLHEWYWDQRDVLIHNQNHLRNRIEAATHVFEDLGKIIELD